MSDQNKTTTSAFTQRPLLLSCTFDAIPDDDTSHKTPQKMTKTSLDCPMTLRGKRLAAYYAHLLHKAAPVDDDTQALRPQALFFGIGPP